MAFAEYTRGDYVISTDRAKLQVGVIHDFLSRASYWARGRSLNTVRRAIENSLCFGVYASSEQAGFARVVTDYATFAWLCDVFVLEPFRGQGLGKWLIECVTTYPDLQNLEGFILATRDAHELYRRYGGFFPLESPEKWMRR